MNPQTHAPPSYTLAVRGVSISYLHEWKNAAGVGLVIDTPSELEDGPLVLLVGAERELLRVRRELPSWLGWDPTEGGMVVGVGVEGDGDGRVEQSFKIEIQIGPDWSKGQIDCFSFISRSHSTT